MSDQRNKIHSVNFAITLAIATLTMIGIMGYNIVSGYGGVITLTEKLDTNDSPLKQFKSGTAAKDVQCNNGLQLVIKAKNNYPACVKPSTVNVLISYGWAKSISENTSTSENQSSNKIITLADNGKSITLSKDESFLLKLGDGYNWNVDIDNQTIVSRAMNIMVVRGAQGVYDTHNLGQTTLTATGDPLCLTANPSCKMPSIQFKINVIVAETLDETNSNGLVVITEKDQYRIGETINITITNNGNTRLFPVGWGYSIEGSDGNHYAPNGVLKMMLAALTPGNSIHWKWDQLDENSIQVMPGQYIITASYTEEDTQKQFSNSKLIEIIQ